MTNAQIIPFPMDRVSISKPAAQGAAGAAQIIIFPGDRWERLKPEHTRLPRPARSKAKRPVLAD